MCDAYDHHKKLLIAGNGGSAADSEHIAGELM
jgi:D-sedoheptulose 7-phosphate isomerase